MKFIPDQNKQTQELYFSKKALNQKSLDRTFNKNNVASSLFATRLGVLLDICLNLQSTCRVTWINATG